MPNEKRNHSMLSVLTAQLAPELRWLEQRRDILDGDGKVDTAATLTRTIAELKMKVAVEAVRVDALVMSRSALPPVMQDPVRRKPTLEEKINRAMEASVGSDVPDKITSAG